MGQVDSERLAEISVELNKIAGLFGLSEVSSPSAQDVQGLRQFIRDTLDELASANARSIDLRDRLDDVRAVAGGLPLAQPWTNEALAVGKRIEELVQQRNEVTKERDQLRTWVDAIMRKEVPRGE